MPPMTRGPLPARTYWVRRLMVFGTALLLVFAIGRMLGGGSDGSDGDAAAQLTAETPSSSAPSTTGTSETPTAAATRTKKPRKGRTSQAPVLAAPTGPCVGSDVVVEPLIRDAVAGRDVTVVLQLRTIESEACTWRVSTDSVTLDVTSGDDRIWASRDCPRAIPRRDVVVRKEAITKVNVTWTQAKRSSDDGCTARTDWAMPGWYHATAAALGGEPSDVQFELTTPTAETITKTATPKQTPTAKPGDQASGKPSGKASGKPKKSPSGSPSGAVEPD